MAWSSFSVYIQHAPNRRPGSHRTSRSPAEITRRDRPRTRRATRPMELPTLRRFQELEHLSPLFLQRRLERHGCCFLVETARLVVGSTPQVYAAGLEALQTESTGFIELDELAQFPSQVADESLLAVYIARLLEFVNGIVSLGLARVRCLGGATREWVVTCSSRPCSGAVPVATNTI
jgi:hypothetical protein